MFAGLGDMMPSIPAMPSFSAASEETKAASDDAKEEAAAPPIPHFGTMTCQCAFSVTHDLKPMGYPLPDDGLNHLAKCKWSCCGEAWNCRDCSSAVAVLNAQKSLSPDNLAKLREASEKLEASKVAEAHERLNPPPAYPSDEGTPELITDKKQRLAAQALASSTPAAAPDAPDAAPIPAAAPAQEADDDAGFLGFLSSLNPLPAMDLAGAYLASGTTATADALGGLLNLMTEQVIMPVITPVFGFDRVELDLAMSSLPDSVDQPAAFDALLSKVAAMYVEMLDLRASDQRMVEGWLRQAVVAWVRVVGVRRPVIQVPAQAVDGEDLLLGLVAELDEAVSGEVSRLNAHLSLAATLSPSRHLSDTVFFDWYVMCRFNQVQFALPEFSGFPVLTDIHSSAVSHVLRTEPAVYALLKDRRCRSGFSFDQAIQWAVDTPGTPTGCVAGDEESFTLFRELYIAVLLKLGAAASRADTQGVGLRSDAWTHGGRFDTSSPVSGWERLDRVYVRGLSLEGSRSVQGFSLPAVANRATRVAVEKLLRQALSQPAVENALRGAVYQSHPQDAPKPLHGSALAAAGGMHDWPYGRGSVASPAPISLQGQSNALALAVNEIDHLRVKVSCDCAIEVNVPLLLREYASVLNKIEDALYETHGHLYMRDATFGYLTSCPELCGTAMRVSATVRLPFLSQPQHDLPGLCRRLGMAAVVVPSPRGDTWALTNRVTFGASEVEVVQGVVDSLNTLVKLEKCHSSGDAAGVAALLAALPASFCVPAIVPADAGIPVQPRTFRGDVKVQVTDDVPLFTDKHKSVAADALRKDPGAYHRLIAKTTAAGGWSVADALRSALDTPDCPVGLLLGGEQSYAAYEKLLVPVIAKLHRNAERLPFNALADVHSTDLSTLDVRGLNALDPLHMRRFRIEVSRNVRGIALAPAISRKLRRKVEHLLYEAVSCIKQAEIDGKYYSLRDLSGKDSAVSAQLAARGLLPMCPPASDPRHAGGIARDWPDARGVFVGNEGLMVMTLNADDHLKVTYECDGSSQSLSDVMHRLSTNIFAIEDALLRAGLTFSHSQRLGFLTSCPSMLGTAMVCQVELYLPRLSRSPSEIHIVCRNFDLTAAPAAAPDVWIVKNPKSLGHSEVEQLQQLVDGVLTLIRSEKEVPPNKAPPGAVVVPGLEPAEETVYASVLRYLVDNPTGCDAAFGIKYGVVRSQYPQLGALVVAMKEISLNWTEGVTSVYTGDAAQLMTESGDRCLWIDPFTRTLHWAPAGQNKTEPHECLRFCDVTHFRPGGYARSGLKPGPRPMCFTLVLRGDSAMHFEMGAGLSDAAERRWTRALMSYIYERPLLDPLIFSAGEI